jgi:HTH-type transcriptional regulator/antitoxin HigA
MKHSYTYVAIPPGETVKEIIEDRGISVSAFAKEMRMKESEIDKLLNGSIPITERIAERLQNTIGVDREFWINLEAGYRDDIIKVDHENNSELKVHSQNMQKGNKKSR